MLLAADRVSRPGAVRSAAAGLALVFEALGLVWGRRDLRRLAAVPLAFSLVLIGTALGLLVGYAGDVYAFLTSWMPLLDAGAWYSWLWIGPGKLFLAVVGVLLFGLVTAGTVVAAGLVASVAAAPFLDALSQRVECIEAGRVISVDESGLRAILGEARRTIGNEAQRVLFFGMLWAAIFFAGVVVPGAQLVTPFALIALTVLFLPLDYAGHLLDRRQLPFHVRRTWLRGNLAVTAGFGTGAFMICLVPGLNFLLLPALVAGGTLLALRYPPAMDVPGSKLDR